MGVQKNEVKNGVTAYKTIHSHSLIKQLTIRVKEKILKIARHKKVRLPSKEAKIRIDSWLCFQKNSDIRVSL